MSNQHNCACDDLDYVSKLYDKLTPEERVKVSTVLEALLDSPIEKELIDKLDKEIEDTRRYLDNPTHRKAADYKFILHLRRFDQLTDLKENIDSLNTNLLKKLMDLDPNTYANKKRMLARERR